MMQRIPLENRQTFNALNFGLALGLTFAIGFLLLGIFSLIFGAWFETFGMGDRFNMQVAPTLVGILFGTLWGFVNGFLAGAVFAWIYNWLQVRKK